MSTLFGTLRKVVERLIGPKTVEIGETITIQTGLNADVFSGPKWDLFFRERRIAALRRRYNKPDKRNNRNV